jgi:hypothetical protein
MILLGCEVRRLLPSRFVRLLRILRLQGQQMRDAVRRAREEVRQISIFSNRSGISARMSNRPPGRSASAMLGQRRRSRKLRLSTRSYAVAGRMASSRSGCRAPLLRYPRRPHRSQAEQGTECCALARTQGQRSRARPSWSKTCFTLDEPATWFEIGAHLGVPPIPTLAVGVSHSAMLRAVPRGTSVTLAPAQRQL